MLDRIPRWVPPLLATIAILCSTIALIFADDDGAKPTTATVELPAAGTGADDTKPGPGGTEVAEDQVEVEVPKAAVDQLERSEVAEHQGARDESPAIAPQGQLDDALDYQDKIRRTQKPLPTAGASQGFQGCTTRFVGNQSSRNGVRPQVQTEHYTVSPNRPGWSDVNAIVAFFNRPGTQASSHFVIDREGHCAYIVPIEAKAWTQASGNPISVSYEIINSGTEGTFMDTAGYAKSRSVKLQVSRRTGIPMRRGAISGCRATRTGIVEHRDFGLCGGGHVDITPFSINAIVRIVTSGAVTSSYFTKVEQRITDKRCYHRREHLAGRDRDENFGWARLYRGKIYGPGRVVIAGKVQLPLVQAIDAARRRDRRSWSYRHRGTRRKQLAAKWSGKGC